MGLETFSIGDFGLTDQGEFERKVRNLRLAQSLAESIRASEVPPEDWKLVVQFLEALLHKQDEPAGGSEATLPSATDMRE